METNQSQGVVRQNWRRKYESALMYSTATLAVFVAAFFTVVESNTCAKNSYNFYGPLNYIEFSICSFLGLMFLGVGIAMILTTKKYVPQFYQEFHCPLILSTCLLSITMLLKGLHSLLYQESSRYLTLYTTRKSLSFST